jgi:uncharacterized protein (DUF1501 family)
MEILAAGCVDLGGWDTHFFQGSEAGLQAESIKLLAQGVGAFDSDMRDHQSLVTTIVMTEFGRRVYENSSLGTDHGRGFAMMAIGSRVNGGTVHGDFPKLDNEEHDLLGPAGLPIAFDYRSVLSELLAGVAGNHQLNAVFPNFRPQSVGLIKGAVIPIASGNQSESVGCQCSHSINEPWQES